MCSEYSLVLLAGGKSSRMGANKAELLYRGKPFLAHMLEKAHALGIEKCYISGSGENWPDVVTVPDRYANRGPLGGLHACMQAVDTPYCLVLPVDAPLLPQFVAEALVQAHRARAEKDRVLIWEHGDRQEPLIAIYPAAMAAVIEELIAAGPAPVFRALDRWGYDRLRLELPRELILNVNTPELYEKLCNET